MCSETSTRVFFECPTDNVFFLECWEKVLRRVTAKVGRAATTNSERKPSSSDSTPATNYGVLTGSRRVFLPWEAAVRRPPPPAPRTVVQRGRAAETCPAGRAPWPHPSALTFVEKPLQVREDAAEIRQTRHELLLV